MSKKASEIQGEVEEFKAKGALKNGVTEKKSTPGIDEEVDYSTLELKTKINGENTISFRVDITGREILLVKSKYERERGKKTKILPEMDDVYFLMMAEQMTGIEYQTFVDLPAIDYKRVRTHVADFLGEE